MSSTLILCKSKTMPLTKSCPECYAIVNVKKSVCDCGHCFVLKRKVSHDTARKSNRIAMKCKRALETTVHMANQRTVESPSDTIG